MPRLVDQYLAPVQEDGLLTAQPLGYGGGGGAITQAVNRATGVTLHKTSGTVTTHTASLAGAASAAFVVTNNKVANTDVVLVTVQGGSNGGNTLVRVTAVANGSFTVTVRNDNAAAGTAETGAIVINFAVLKSVAA